MTRPRCPDHGPLVFNETTDEARWVGNLSFEREERYRVDTYVCPVAGCREVRTVTR